MTRPCAASAMAGSGSAETPARRVVRAGGRSTEPPPESALRRVAALRHEGHAAARREARRCSRVHADARLAPGRAEKACGASRARAHARLPVLAGHGSDHVVFAATQAHAPGMALEAGRAAIVAWAPGAVVTRAGDGPPCRPSLRPSAQSRQARVGSRGSTGVRDAKRAPCGRAEVKVACLPPPDAGTVSGDVPARAAAGTRKADRVSAARATTRRSPRSAARAPG